MEIRALLSQNALLRFEGFLHAALLTVQVLIFRGYSWWVDGWTWFYIALMAGIELVCIAVAVSGVCTAVACCLFGKKRAAAVVGLQCVGALASLCWYNVFLPRVSDPAAVGLERWILTPYLLSVAVGGIFVLAPHAMRKRGIF